MFIRVKTSWRKHKDPITNNAYIAKRYGKRQTFQAFQELMKFSFCVDHEKRTSAKSYCRPATEKNYHNPVTLGNWTLLELLPTRFYPEQLDTNSKLDHPDLTQVENGKEIRIIHLIHLSVFLIRMSLPLIKGKLASLVLFWSLNLLLQF